MKETIYTIPINDAFSKKHGCPICTLHDDLERSSVEYVLGGAMMEPNVRLSTNRLGFCAHHFKALLEAGNRLSLALILESHLKELSDKLFALDTAKLKKRDFEALASMFSQSHDDCFICAQISSRMEKYYKNIVYLWKKDDSFREKVRSSEFFCLKHLSELFTIECNAQMYEDFAGVSRRRLSELGDNVSAFCKSFDHLAAATPLCDEVKSAITDAIKFLN